MPDFSILAISSLLDLLNMGDTTVNSSQAAEVKELARVLEVREVEEEEVSGGLVSRGLMWLFRYSTSKKTKMTTSCRRTLRFV